MNTVKYKGMTHIVRSFNIYLSKKYKGKMKEAVLTTFQLKRMFDVSQFDFNLI